jgi:hypothetical protein
MADKFSLKAIISAVDKLSPTLKGIRLNAKITQKSLLDIKAASGSLLTSAGVTGAAVAGSIFGAVKKIVGVSAEFERFQTILETIEGSSSKARSSMAWIESFAVKTPYELQEVTDSFVKLKAYGIDPMNGSLESTGNAAAAMGKPVIQAVEALADAMTGENERLKEFGIKASKTGDQIKYTWTENGKTMVAAAKASSKEQIEAVITGIWNRRFGGAMDKLSGTWDGMWSNMMDQFTKFVKKIGGGGFFDAIKTQLQGMLGVVDQWEKDGTLDRIAKQISTELIATLQDLATWVKSVDWGEFFRGVRDTIVSIKNFISAIGGLKTVLIVLGVLMLAGPVASLVQIGAAIIRLLPIIFTLGKAFLLLVAANPVMLAIIAVVVALGAAVYAIYKNWDPLKGWFENLWTGIKAIFEQGWENLKTMLSWSPLGLIMQAWGPVAEFFSGLWKTVSNISGAAPVQTSAPTTNAPGGGNNFNGLNGRTQLNGEMTVKFENAPPGMRVDPGKTNQPGLTMNPDVGYRQLAYTL